MGVNHFKCKDMKYLRKSLSYTEYSGKASSNAYPAFVFLLRHLLWATNSEKTLRWTMGLTSLVLMITEEWNEISKQALKKTLGTRLQLLPVAVVSLCWMCSTGQNKCWTLKVLCSPSDPWADV